MANKSTSRPEDELLPKFTSGELVSIESTKAINTKTKPPAKYTEGAWLSDMEGAAKYLENSEFAKVLKKVEGIGRPATRHEIIEKLKRTGFVRIQGKYIEPTEKGMELIALVPQELRDLELTARWEARLDLIAKEGKREQFESDVVKEIVRLGLIIDQLEISDKLKAQKSKEGDSKPSSNQKSLPPSEKQIAFAQKLSKDKGISLPAGFDKSMQACSEFIKQCLEGSASAPVDKVPTLAQINFAKGVADRKKAKLPEATLKSTQKLTAWLKEHNV